MKNGMMRAYLTLGCLFLLTTVIALVIPMEKTATFWTAYVFTVLAFALQPFIWKRAWDGRETVKSKFLGIPLLQIGAVYLLIQLLLCLIFTLISNAPLWAAILSCALLFGLTVMCLISADAGREEIERVEKKVRGKTLWVAEMRDKVEALAAAKKQAEVKQALQKLAEEIRFSDPMSSEEVADVEQNFAEGLEDLKTAENRLDKIEALRLLLKERNSACRRLK